MPNYLPYYWIRHNAIPKSLCEIMLQERQQMSDAQAGVGMNNETAPNGLRKTGIAWAERNHWLEGIMLNNARYANRETGWNMELDTCEQVQLAKYETGHFYDWHQDIFFLADTSTCRKVTVVALLNDPTEFAGGDFELQNCDSSGLVLEQGSLIAFPSYLNHRATQVTAGTRYSAALWVHGPNFK
jgi:predicted 2-oxoglutarate/Fe(II)-dependent dioxygenase YbiX